MKIFLLAPFMGKLDSRTGLIEDWYKIWLEKIINFLKSKGHKVISKHVREEWGKKLQDPKTALQVDLKSVKTSDLIVAYLGNPYSPGVQMELGIALCFNKRIIILTESISNLPYLVQGLPDKTTKCIEFKNEEDLITKLDRYI